MSEERYTAYKQFQYELVRCRFCGQETDVVYIEDCEYREYTRDMIAHRTCIEAFMAGLRAAFK